MGPLQRNGKNCFLGTLVFKEMSWHVICQSFLRVYVLADIKRTHSIIKIDPNCLSTPNIQSYVAFSCKWLSSSHLGMSHTCQPLRRLKTITGRRLACDPWKGHSDRLTAKHAHTGLICIVPWFVPQCAHTLQLLCFAILGLSIFLQHLSEQAINLRRILLKRWMVVWIMHQFY